MPSLCKRNGFTLVELMITVAISGILTVIVFTSLAQERTRNSLKLAANQMQVDLQGLQNNLQTGIVAPKTSCLGGSDDRKICPPACAGSVPCQLRPPRGWGLQAVVDGTSYILFSDMPGAVAGAYDSAGGNLDALVQTKLFSPNITIHRITCTGCSVTPTAVDITFSGSKGDAALRITPSGGSASTATIILRHSTLNVCYAVTVRTVGGLVTKRQTTGC